MHKCISNEFDNIKPVFGAFLLEKYSNSGTRYIGNEKWYMNPRMKTWWIISVGGGVYCGLVSAMKHPTYLSGVTKCQGGCLVWILRYINKISNTIPCRSGALQIPLCAYNMNHNIPSQMPNILTKKASTLPIGVLQNEYRSFV